MMTLNVITDFLIWGLLEVVAVRGLIQWLAIFDIVYFSMQCVIQVLIAVLLLNISKLSQITYRDSTTTDDETAVPMDVHYYTNQGQALIPTYKRRLSSADSRSSSSSP
jgi:hypothetical protein